MTDNDLKAIGVAIAALFALLFMIVGSCLASAAIKKESEGAGFGAVMAFMAAITIVLIMFGILATK